MTTKNRFSCVEDKENKNVKFLHWNVYGWGYWLCEIQHFVIHELQKSKITTSFYDQLSARQLCELWMIHIKHQKISFYFVETKTIYNEISIFFLLLLLFVLFTVEPIKWDIFMHLMCSRWIFLNSCWYWDWLTICIMYMWSMNVAFLWISQAYQFFNVYPLKQSIDKQFRVLWLPIWIDLQTIKWLK